MKLTTWAKQQGISYTTPWRWWKAGKLPVASEQVASGAIIVHAHGSAQGVAIYARVSSADQKADLDRQIVRSGKNTTTLQLPVGMQAGEEHVHAQERERGHY